MKASGFFVKLYYQRNHKYERLLAWFSQSRLQELYFAIPTSDREILTSEALTKVKLGPQRKMDEGTPQKVETRWADGLTIDHTPPCAQAESVYDN